MPDISSIGSGSVGPIDRLVTSPETGPDSSRATSETLAREADSVELSEHARLLTRLKELPDGRADVIQRARSQIAEGVFETPERLDTAIDRLRDDLHAGT